MIVFENLDGVEDRWYSIKEAIPPIGYDVIVCSNGHVCGGWRIDQKLWKFGSVERISVTHWCKLPEPPEQQ